MVVPVLITNCQVSENLNMGPLAAHTMMTAMAIRKAVEDPVALVILLLALSKKVFMELLFFCLFILLELRITNSSRSLLSSKKPTPSK